MKKTTISTPLKTKSSTTTPMTASTTTSTIILIFTMPEGENRNEATDTKLNCARSQQTLFYYGGVKVEISKKIIFL
jgi:hypothetical protein